MYWTRRSNCLKGHVKHENLCYLAKCKICDKSYIGRTVDPLHKRINGHRQHFKEILKEIEEKTTLDEIDTSKDKYIYMLGLHLYLEHQINDTDVSDRLIK